MVAPENTAEPQVTGVEEPGQVLTAAPGAWTGGALEYSYQWQRCHYWGCRDVPGASQATYTATAGDLGYRLRASVTAANAAGSSTSTSAVTATISARPPTSTYRPTILGTVEEGQTVTAANGGWEGTPPFDFDYEWERCDAAGTNCVDIYGATDAAYVVRTNDVGRKIRVRVIAANLGGTRSAASLSSDTVPGRPETMPAFKQHWPYVAGVASLHAAPAGPAEPGTIAIVDSGIDASRADFGNRVIEQVTKTERAPNSPGDGYGHGTAVASVAAGQAEGYVGAAPGAKLVSIDVLDDNGVGNVSDVIAAADWIYENRERLDIRVANFSLHGTTLASLVSDPLDRAVERLWQSGIVVVAASGNYAVDGAESAVPFAPGNDPFILTVGATDTRGSFTQRDDIAAPWSAWGYTRDGFAKPELVAPGRYIAAAVSADAKLARDRPDRVVEPGYLQLSGTSLAAPVVAGTVSTLLGRHPSWTPDQVKGALMLTAKPLPQATPRSVGVGAVSAADAAAVVDPPEPAPRAQRVSRRRPRRGPDPRLRCSPVDGRGRGRRGLGLRCLGIGRLGQCRLVERGLGLGCLGLSRLGIRGLGLRRLGLGCLGLGGVGQRRERRRALRRRLLGARELTATRGQRQDGGGGPCGALRRHLTREPCPGVAATPGAGFALRRPTDRGLRPSQGGKAPEAPADDIRIDRGGKLVAHVWPPIAACQKSSLGARVNSSSRMERGD